MILQIKALRNRGTLFPISREVLEAMLKSTELRRELGEIEARVKAGTATSQDQTRIVEIGTQIAKALADESQQRAGLAGQEPDAESLEKRELLRRAKVADFVKACIEHVPVTGASKEAAQACGMTGEHEVPLELFEPEKTKAVTPAPSDKPVVQRPVQPYIYQRTVAGYLGIDMPSVPGGIAAYPTLMSNTPASMKAKDGAADSTAAAVSVLKSECKRLTGQYVVRVEDMSMFPELEPALRRDIPRSLADTLDNQLLAGSGTSPELKSLFSQLADPTADTAVETFASFISTITGELDGVHAYELADLKALVGMKTYEKMTETFATNTAVSAADYLHDRIGGLRASKRVAAPVSDNQQAIVRLGMEGMVAVAPTWGGVVLVSDPYSGAGKGQHTITARQLVGDVLMLRSEAFAQVDFHLA